jgi:hypothetical protein
MRISDFILLVVISVLVSCATKVVGIYNPEVAQTKPKTYGVYAVDDYASISEDNKKLDNRLQSIIGKDLELKGLKESALPDIYVSYIISIHTSSETRQDEYNTYNRYNYNSPYNQYTTRNYKEGVLIIDVRNEDQKLIWQGSKAFKVGSKQSIGELLPGICNEIIAVYTIGGEQ